MSRQFTDSHSGVCYECVRSVTTDEPSVVLHDACHDEILKATDSIRADRDRYKAALEEIVDCDECVHCFRVAQRALAPRKEEKP